MVIVALCLVTLFAGSEAFATAILTFSLSTTPSPALPGQQLSVVIDWSHNEGNCSGGLLELQFPSSDLTFTSASQGGAPVGGNAVQWNFPATHGGRRGGSFYATFSVSPLLSPLTVLSFPVSLSGSNCGVVLPPMTETEVPVKPAAELALAKTVSASTAATGDTLSYTLAYRNTGNADAQNVTLTDTLPAGLQFVSATGGGSAMGNVVTWNLGTLLHGSASSVSLQAKVTAMSGTVTNTATVAATDTASAMASADTLVASQPDLVIEKTGAEVVESGGQVTYDIRWANRGSATATGVKVVDTFSPLVTPLVTVGGTVMGGTIEWTLGSVPPGASGTLVYTALVDTGLPDGTPIHNSATISGTNAASAVATHDVFTSSQPNLLLTKVGPAVAQAGATIFYELDFRNVGLGDATNVVLEDTPPSNCHVVSAGQGTFDAGSGKWRWNLGTLPGGAGGSVSLFCTVDEGLADGTIITNNADLTGGGTWGVTALAVTQVRSQAVLEVVKTASSPQVAAGGYLTYEIEVRNTGNGTASNVTITDDLDARTTFVAASGGGTPMGSTVSWTIGTLAPGEGTSRTVTVQVATPLADGTQITNSATADSAETLPQTSIPIAVQVNSAPRLVVEKSASVPWASAGGKLTYTLTVRNRGNDQATNVQLTDVLPQDVSFVSATGGGSAGSGTVTWSLGTLAAGATSSVTLTVKVANGLLNGTPLLNTATVDCTETKPTSVSSFVPVSSQTRLTLTKTASADVVQAGGTLTYRLDYANTGNQVASHALLSDILPSNVQFVSASPGGVYTAATRSVAWALGTVSPGQSGSASLTVMVESPLADGTRLVNAALLGCDQTSTTAQAATRVSSSPRLTITKVASPTGAVAAGGQVAYTIAFANDGTDAATGVTLVDSLPPEVTAAPVVISGGGIYSSMARTVTWNLGTVPAGATGTRDLVLQVPAGTANGTPIVNAVALLATNAATVNALASSNVGSAPRLVNRLFVDQSVAPAGAVLSYTAEVQNVGSAAATGVQLEFPIPADTVHVFNSAGAVVSGGKLILQIGTLAPGSGRSFLIYVRVATPLPNNTVIEALSTATSTNAPPASASASTRIASAPALAVAKVAQANVSAGGQLLYSLQYRNTGSDAASGVVLRDSLPPHTQFVSASAGGIASGGQVSWNLGTLAAGASGTVTLLLGVDSPLANGTLLVNQASLTSKEIPPVAAGANTAVTSAPVLRVEKVAGANSVAAGGSVLFTLRYFNDGNDTAHGVTLVDQLPAGGFPVVFSQGTYDPMAGTLTWNIGDVPAGGRGERYVTVLFPNDLDDGLILTNGALLSGTNGAGSSMHIPVLISSAPALRVDLRVDKAEVESGGVLKYTVDVQNVGNRTAQPVLVQLPIPPNTTLVGASAGAAVANGMVTWAIPQLGPGAGRNFFMTVQVGKGLPNGTEIATAVICTPGGGSSVTSQARSIVRNPPVPAPVPALSAPGLLLALAILALVSGIAIRRLGGDLR